MNLPKKIDDLFFLYDGKTLDNEKTFQEEANKMDKIRKIMNVIVNDMEQKTLTLRKSKYAICPECNECICILISDNKISLYECRNGNKKDNILFNEFENTQCINLLKIVCDKCKITKKVKLLKINFIYSIHAK